LGQVKPKDRVVIHAAISGMGTMLGTMAKVLGASVICTTTSQDKVNSLISAFQYDEKVCGILYGDFID
jgi:NADPH:quinone reductase-like Zn-dependent oxidoreductase